MIAEVALDVPVDRTFDYQVPESVFNSAPDSLVGCRVTVPFGFRTAVGVVLALKEDTQAGPYKMKPLASLVDAHPVLTTDLVELGRWLSRRYACSIGEGIFALLPSAAKARVSNDHFEDGMFHPGPYSEMSAPLTEEQVSAIERIETLATAGGFAKALLFGVAAAGKTEVYLHVAKTIVAQGKNVLVIVPEVGLSIQTAAIFRERFGEEHVLLWNNDLTPKERLIAWNACREGKYSVVVGARSASLLPVPHIGLIVVDEEHDPLLKEERKPRYHARDVAIKRVEQHDAILILGSATPSLESYSSALKGEMELIEMKSRAVAAAKPSVRLVDLNKEIAKGLLSTSLRKAMEERLQRREQTILFLNRRGFHRFLICPDCKWVARCPDCQITLVPPSLNCAFCNKRQVFTACPDCGGKKLKAGGFGTQRIFEEVQKEFPWANVLRWDGDAAGKKNAQKNLYGEMKEGKVDILVGTQIVAHGLNFPRVTLIGVLNADSSLFTQDFRASEWTAQLLMQLAGRAGREMISGEVIIQTRHPDHDAILSIEKMDYGSFAEHELHFRKDLNYPPFSHLVRIVVDKKSEPALLKLIDNFRSSEFGEKIGFLGPMPSSGARHSKGSQLLLKIPLEIFEPVLDFLKVFLAKKNSFWIDIDPSKIG